MRIFSLIKGLLIAIFSAILGGGIFFTLVIGLIYLTRGMLPISRAEAPPPLWIYLLGIAVLVGVALSATFSGLWGYSRYRKSLTNSSGTPNGAC